MKDVEVYINKIMEETGMTRAEIQVLIDEKKDELKGLISPEGTLFIISKELGIDIKEKPKIANIYIVDLQKDMKNIIVIGKIKRIYDAHEFTKKDGSGGIVQNFIIHDKTGDIRVVIWDKHVDEVIPNTDFVKNTLVKIVNGYMRWSDYHNKYELHVARWGKLVFNPEVENEDEYPEVEVFNQEGW